MTPAGRLDPHSDAVQGALADIAAGLDPVASARRRGIDTSDPDELRRLLRRAASMSIHPSAGPKRRDTALAAMQRLDTIWPEEA